MLCQNSNPPCLSLSFRGNIVRISNSSKLLIRSCLRCPDPRRGTGILCKNCIATCISETTNVGISETDVCAACVSHFKRKSATATTGSGHMAAERVAERVADQTVCPNCRSLKVHSMDPLQLPFARSPQTKELLRKYLGDIRETPMVIKTRKISNPLPNDHRFGVGLFRNFICKRCGHDDPVALFLCLYPTGKIPLSKVTPLEFIECLSSGKDSNHEKTGVFCDVCSRILYGFDGSRADAHYFFKTRCQHERMSRFVQLASLAAPVPCCALCQRERTPENVRCFQFDHVDPLEKYKSICSMILLNETDENIFKEMEKCRILCTNCHIRNTFNQGYSFHLKNPPPKLLGCLGRLML